MDSYASPRPRRAAATKASGQITSQYSTPRSCKNLSYAAIDDHEFVPELADDDHELVALSPSQLRTRTPRRPCVSATLPPTPPTTALPTSASILSLKSKSSADAGLVLAKPFGIPNPQQDLLRNRLDPDENRYERKAISSSVLIESDGDPFSFAYDKLALQPGRHYEVDVEEIPAYKTPNSKQYRPSAWDLQGRQSADARKFVRLKRDGFTWDEAMGICRKFVDALNIWPDINDISSPVGHRELQIFTST
ncbi:hypothetical protein BGZ61DRAFT_535424 [Ilyonectria robusta]|uniref:uncharacterized protein n=1 Tax=Ilyonectria robusta TaxID=1079257 RepID=UPI001E8E65D0|nr:uncharacterized protein BGZ61DRAFT_535424 [Ilyonectria robusta]KAH8680356.1 hypothetical protein BGZ61DRAFT_535424 [Ilyonectria robusta]